MLKINHLWLVFLMSTSLVVSTNAQTLEERNRNVEGVDKAALESLKAEYKRQYVISEDNVLKYLKKHPKVKRTFVKDGSTYHLQKIDRDGKPVYIRTNNRESSKLIKADQLYKDGSIGVNITGEGMVVGVWDGGGVRATHELLSGKVTMQANPTLDGVGADKSYSGNDHMTHVTGTIVGKDLAGKPRGIAYGAKALCYDWDDDLQEMLQFAEKGYLISNHSYGNPLDSTTPAWSFGAYIDGSKNWDKLTRTFPYYLPFAAAGNSQQSSGNRKDKLGYDNMYSFQAAKNVMTVGAIDGDKAMSDYSNWGPTDDGRVKPEIVARGTGINSSTFADKNTKTPSDTSYSGNGVESSGTSYSSPAVAGGGLLLQQYYNSLNKSYMKSSTLKALMLATAEDLGQPGPDKSVVSGSKKNIVSDTASRGAYIEEISLKFPADTTTEVSREVTANGCEPLIVSIAWTDIEGVEQTAQDGIDPTTSRLIYDYDLIVRNVSKNTTFRAWKPSVMANRTEDATLEKTWFDGNGNNFKQVKIEKAIAGDKYKIFLRKKTTSPDSAMMLSLVVTGTAYAKPVLATTQNFCSPSSATLADLTVTGTGIKWYDAATGGNVLPTTTALATATSYYASQTILGCESLRAAVAITKSPVLEAPVALEATAKLGTSVTLTASCTAGIPNWYAASTDGASLGSVSFKTPELEGNVAYYVACESGGKPNCVSSRTHQVVRVHITGSVEPKPTAENIASKSTRLTNENTGENPDVSVDVFPNPTTGMFNWKLQSKEMTDVYLMLSNLVGKEQISQTSPIPSQVHEGTIDLSKFSTGAYILKFKAGEKIITKKIIKN
jgi:serine protease AprX